MTKNELLQSLMTDNPDRGLIDCRKLADNQIKICDDLSKWFRFIQNDNIRSLLNVKDLSAISFEGEAESIMNSVKDKVASVCDKLAKRDDIFSGYVFQSGSVGEKSQVGYQMNLILYWS